jgi:hypothetical protein
MSGFSIRNRALLLIIWLLSQQVLALSPISGSGALCDGSTSIECPMNEHQHHHAFPNVMPDHEQTNDPTNSFSCDHCSAFCHIFLTAIIAAPMLAVHISRYTPSAYSIHVKSPTNSLYRPPIFA